jgi:uncharacterized membrane protein
VDRPGNLSYAWAMRPPAHPSPAAQKIGFERLIFFSDAVFAIAITLLVLDLKPPPLNHGRLDLGPLVPSLIGFGISFYAIGRYWLAHHHLMETVQGYDARLLRMNLLFLAGVAFLPFTTSLVAQLPIHVGVAPLYALSMAVVGLLMAALILTARRPGLLRPGETAGGTARMAVGSLGSPLVFLITAAVATRYPVGSLWLIWSLLPVGWATNRLGEALERRLDQPAPKTKTRAKTKTKAAGAS